MVLHHESSVRAAFGSDWSGERHCVRGAQERAPRRADALPLAARRMLLRSDSMGGRHWAEYVSWMAACVLSVGALLPAGRNRAAPADGGAWEGALAKSGLWSGGSGVGRRRAFNGVDPSESASLFQCSSGQSNARGPPGAVFNGLLGSRNAPNVRLDSPFGIHYGQRRAHLPGRLLHAAMGHSPERRSREAQHQREPGRPSAQEGAHTQRTRRAVQPRAAPGESLRQHAGDDRAEDGHASGLRCDARRRARHRLRVRPVSAGERRGARQGALRPVVHEGPGGAIAEQVRLHRCESHGLRGGVRREVRGVDSRFGVLGQRIWPHRLAP